MEGRANGIIFSELSATKKKKKRLGLWVYDVNLAVKNMGVWRHVKALCIPQVFVKT